MAVSLRLLSACSSLITNKTLVSASKSCVFRSNCLLNRGIKRYVRAVKTEMKRRKDKMDPQPPHPRNTYAEWNYNSELFAFGKRLGEDFNKEFLQQAFVERSYIISEEEKQKKVGIEEPQILLKDNREYAEKGEYIIAEYSKRYLRTVYPRFPEEGICSVSDYLLSDDVLADISIHIGTSDLILTPDYPPSDKTLANVLKAVVYALSLSSGEDKASIFVRDFIITYLSGKDINELWSIKNPESVLASILEREGKSSVEPRLTGEAGKNTILSAFQVGLYCNKELVGMGFGESIPVAKEVAAMDALKRLFHTTERAKPIPFDLVLASDKKEPFANISIEDWCEKNIKSMVTKH
ncbi:39S ribosomal protein L44, mitochondrial [Homalodisca vitripennis]|uniref:39S ribosomal protein L44, mitochondrial n=1 Tax=Homalodisca vitripennis TaxID=197043 RepID=UPI001EEC919D|nr:39S ribosomal protein L44, mitochondrial [Homalodisca vitripennis]